LTKALTHGIIKLSKEQSEVMIYEEAGIYDDLL
jgi:hypothetical protein